MKIFEDYQHSLIEAEQNLVIINNSINTDCDAFDEHNGKIYLNNVANHNIENDSNFLLSHIFAEEVDNLLDVGYGNGRLLDKFKSNKQSTSATGVEKSLFLFKSSYSYLTSKKISLYNCDFINFSTSQLFDVVTMSFFLHHVDNIQEHIKKSLSLLTDRGRLIIMDRIAINKNAASDFNRFWNESYKSTHEWEERCPNIFSKSMLIDEAIINNYKKINFFCVPNDNRVGASSFPKILAVIKK